MIFALRCGCDRRIPGGTFPPGRLSRPFSHAADLLCDLVGIACHCREENLTDTPFDSG
jgi:hypothetical protein